ncbi:MAG TPA: cytochrome P450, partial [Rhodobacteraceae bacterium]|nr:cytochrome P450 [Paracoccaceae bacterium]
RLTSEPIKLSSATLPAGTYVHTSIAGANRDPEVFDKPETVDITRKPNRHLAFITGIHVCLGATLARIEGKIALGGLVKRFPNIQSSGPATIMPLARFRGYNTLPVRV